MVKKAPEGETINKGPRNNVPPKIGYMGWYIVRTATKRMMRCAPAGFAAAKANLAGQPKVCWWPILDDYEGPKLMIDAIMQTDRGYLHELTLRFPEHHFGFEEVLLTDYQRGGEVVERQTLRTVTLPREHRLDIDAVKLLDNRVQVVAYVRRGMKDIASEVLYDSTMPDKPMQTDGTGNALLTMSVPE